MSNFVPFIKEMLSHITAGDKNSEQWNNTSVMLWPTQSGLKYSLWKILWLYHILGRVYFHWKWRDLFYHYTYRFSTFILSSGHGKSHNDLHLSMRHTSALEITETLYRRCDTQPPNVNVTLLKICAMPNWFQCQGQERFETICLIWHKMADIGYFSLHEWIQRKLQHHVEFKSKFP